ncbi:hypothetical protein [Geobacillus thermodenitrificans]|uniref:hypothetical protein n=1 Tax=Geobacillus thermodenitrificans TaxID=33940 RepID=UPI002E1DC983|nr:hypothetical protein [Geobacillus thermodenitrificans]
MAMKWILFDSVLIAGTMALSAALGIDVERTLLVAILAIVLRLERELGEWKKIEK